MHTTHEHWDDTRLPTDGWIGPCIQLSPGTTNVWLTLEIGTPKTFSQVEGIVLSHVRLVGKGLDSAVP